MFPGVRVCDTWSTFPLGVEKKTSTYSKRDLSACDRNGKEAESGNDGCAKWRCCLHVCTTFVLFITFTHPQPTRIILTISCGRSVLNYYLLEFDPERSPISQMFQTAARPRVTTALALMVFFCGEESTLGVLFSSSFWAFRLHWELFFIFPLKLSEADSPNSMLCPAAAVLRDLKVQHLLPGQAAQEDLRTQEGLRCKCREDGAGKISWDLAEPSAAVWTCQTPFWEAVSSLLVSTLHKEVRFCTLFVNKWSCVTHLSYH